MTCGDPNALNILIVEDDLDAQTNLQDILELEGYESELAYCARDVREHERLDRFDVILLDRHLPDGTGDKLLPHIKSKAPLAAVILITGYADMEGAVMALRHGAADFLTKPIEPDVLRSRLSRINEQLRMRRELLEAQQRLLQSERLAAIGQTITALSHEARNELNGLKMGLNLLPHILDDREAVLETVDQLAENEDRLHRLFEDVRGFAAPIQLDRATCGIDEIWRKAWSSLNSVWHHREVTLEEEIGEVSVTLPLDAFRLEQVFRNLFENSLAACSDPVSIAVSCAAVREGFLEIAVRDNGPGLSGEQKQKVFDAFFTTKSRGTGLGMAIAKRIIEAHGGTIAVGDASAGGAEFVITLPVAEEYRGAAEPVRPEHDRQIYPVHWSDSAELAVVPVSGDSRENPWM